ncbi:hypothetical protein CSB20_10810 [bacterium DOLZORAL124_64_63]|nr:MAG: hypothetical protein CSB20_10810 [bacterium DOLZORAL124_64_63]
MGYLRLSLLCRVAVMSVAAVGFAAGGELADRPQAPDALQAKIQENSSELEELRSRIAQLRAEQQALDDREQQIRRGRAEVLEEIELTGRMLSQMDERQRLLAAQNSALQDELVRSARRYEASCQALGQHLRAMYVRGRQGKLEAVLTAGSFSEFAIRTRWESLMAQLGAGLVDDTRAEGRRLSSRHKMLQVSLAEINRNREDAAAERSRMEDLLAEQMAALRDLETRRRGMSDRLLELSMNEQRLNYVLSDLEDLRARRQAEAGVQAEDGIQAGAEIGSAVLAGLAGQLDWPVQGELVRGFGRSVHPRFQTVTVNNGVNIAAPLGAPVAAVAGGQVEFCDRLPGFGQCVILDHGAGYYTLYAHLDRAFVSAGGQAARGQVIAEVGRPAAGESPQLYFEIRQGKTPLDPADWLRSR